MRTFTIPEIRSHFNSVPYSSSTTFMALLVKNNVLVRMSVSTYAYDLNRLSKDLIDLIIDECRQKQLAYTRKCYGTANRTHSKKPNKNG